MTFADTRRESDISFSAINRMIEDSPLAKRRVRKSGGWTLSRARRYTDEELQRQLKSLGVTLDGPADLRARVGEALSAEAVTDAVAASAQPLLDGAELDRLWCLLTVLWERWMPERPSFERLDDRMQEGYQWLYPKGARKPDREEACRIWATVWESLRAICQHRGFRTFKEIDAVFRGTQSVYNWIQDFEMELGNTGRRDEALLEVRESLCREVLDWFEMDRLTTTNFQRGLIEAIGRRGRREEAEAGYKGWMEEHPTDLWMLMDWADLYLEEPERAIPLVRRALDLAEDTQDRDACACRLVDALEADGRDDEAEAVRVEYRLDELGGEEEDDWDLEPGDDPWHDHHREPHLDFGGYNDTPESVPGQTVVVGPKIGRNDPCPCGSGKKYKKCCWRRDAGRQ